MKKDSIWRVKTRSEVKPSAEKSQPVRAKQPVTEKKLPTQVKQIQRRKTVAGWAAFEARTAGAQLLELLYPRRCPVCREIVVPKGKLICPECRTKLKLIREPYCKGCGRQLFHMEQEFCSECLKQPRHFQCGYAVWQYDAAIRRSLSDFKYHARREFADFYAAEAVRRYGKAIRMDAPQVLIPVPVHRLRKRDRGFNQAEVLARKIGILLGLPTDSRYLIRCKETCALKELNRKEREAQLRGAFRVRGRGAEGPYHRVLLVDDIYTTGSTMEECTRVLMEAGVQKVYCLSMAAVTAVQTVNA